MLLTLAELPSLVLINKVIQIIMYKLGNNITTIELSIMSASFPYYKSVGIKSLGDPPPLKETFWPVDSTLEVTRLPQPPKKSFMEVVEAFCGDLVKIFWNFSKIILWGFFYARNRLRVLKNHENVFLTLNQPTFIQFLVSFWFWVHLSVKNFLSAQNVDCQKILIYLLHSKIC
jgi:hypothetical protein